MQNDNHAIIRTAFRVQGMDCADEVALLRNALSKLPGIEDIVFEILNGRMTVTYSADTVSPEGIISAVSQTGMTASVSGNSTKMESEAPDGAMSRHRTWLTALSAAGLVAGTGTHVLEHGWHDVFMEGAESSVPWLAQIFYLFAIGLAVWPVIPKAWLALRHLRPDMNLLMTVAIVGALFIGEFLEAATVAFLFAVSLALESWSVGRARRSIAALMTLSPPTALVRRQDGGEFSLELNAVPVGSTIIIKPGEKIPLDGRVAVGETTVNQAPITGESVPVAKAPGDEVYAGTINHDGAIEVITTKPFQDTTLARIIKLVGDAQSQRSPSEQWVEKFAWYYTPCVLALALLVMIIPPLATNASWMKWFYEGLVLLVVSCPCALVISTPVSIVAAMTSAARNGVLIKGGPFIEAPARLQAIALDKTGTLTEGRPQVRQVIPLDGHTETTVLEVAAALEARSTHPFAVAISTEASRRGLSPKTAENFQAVPGKGATASFNGQSIWLGSHRHLEERGQETSEMHKQLNELAESGLSVVVVGQGEKVIGFISLADKVRPNAKAAISAIRQAGIGHVIMLTGDNKATGEAVGQQTGVDEVRAEMLPEDKLAAMTDLVRRYREVAMVGDGVNDAPAMARATLGIAMGAIGTDAAIETADIALMSDDLSKLAWLVHHSRRTLSIIRQNIIASLGVKAVFVVLTLSGAASLWSAIVADTGTSLLVIFNGLRLLTDNTSDSVASDKPPEADSLSS